METEGKESEDYEKNTQYESKKSQKVHVPPNRRID